MPSSFDRWNEFDTAGECQQDELIFDHLKRWASDVTDVRERFELARDALLMISRRGNSLDQFLADLGIAREKFYTYLLINMS